MDCSTKMPMSLRHTISFRLYTHLRDRSPGLQPIHSIDMMTLRYSIRCFVIVQDGNSNKRGAAMLCWAFLGMLSTFYSMQCRHLSHSCDRFSRHTEPRLSLFRGLSAKQASQSASINLVAISNGSTGGDADIGVSSNLPARVPYPCCLKRVRSVHSALCETYNLGFYSTVWRVSIEMCR